MPASNSVASVVATLRIETTAARQQLGRDLADTGKSAGAQAGKQASGAFKVDTRAASKALSSELATGGKAAGKKAGEEAGKSFSASFKEKAKDLAKEALPVLGTAAVVEGVKKTIEAASDLNETVSKTKVVFGNSAQDIIDWSKSSATAMGISQRAALDGASSFQNLFSQIGITGGAASKMSKNLVQLSSDFASFHNADPAEVMDALLSATRGEYDALQKFVPTVSAATIQTRAMADAGTTSAKSLTAAQQATALYEIVTEQAGAATGDFARTSGGAANQQRIFQANLENTAASVGKTVLPAYQGLLHLVNQMGPVTTVAIAATLLFGNKITDFSKKSVKDFDSFGKAATAAGGKLKNVWSNTSGLTKLAGAITLVQIASAALGTSAAPDIDAFENTLIDFGKTGQESGQVLRTFGKDLEFLKYDLGTLGTGGLAKTGNAVAGFTEQISGLGGVFDESLQHAKERIGGLDDALAKMVSDGHANDAAAVFGRLEVIARSQGISVSDLTKGLPKYSAAVENADAATKAKLKTDQEHGGILEALVGDYATYTDAVAKSVTQSGQMSSQIGAVTTAFDDLADPTKTAADHIKTLTDLGQRFQGVQGPLSHVTKDVAQALVDEAYSADNATDKVNALKAAVDLLYGSQIAQREATEGQRDSFFALQTQMKDGNSTFDESKAKNEEQNKAIDDNRNALESALDANRQTYYANIQNGDSIDQANQKYDANKKKILDLIPVNQRQSASVQDIVTQYNDIPPQKNTNVTSSGLEAVLDQLLKAKAAQISLDHPDISVDDAYSNLLSERGRLASGGHAAAGGYITGPGGPTDDKVPVWLSNGEYVIRAAAVSKIGLDKLNDLNKAGELKPSGLGGDGSEGVSFRRYANGGLVDWPFNVSTAGIKVPKAEIDGISVDTLVKAQQFIKDQVGKPYIWDSAGPAGYDCSGIVSAVYNLLGGNNPYSHTFSTESLPGGFLSPGSGNVLTVGYAHPGQAGASASVGHTAAKLVGLGFESTGSTGVRAGASATSPSSFANIGHAFDAGGVWKHNTVGHNTSGHDEYVATTKDSLQNVELGDRSLKKLAQVQATQPVQLVARGEVIGDLALEAYANSLPNFGVR